MGPRSWQQVAKEVEQKIRELVEVGEEGSYIDYLEEKARVARRESWRDNIWEEDNETL